MPKAPTKRHFVTLMRPTRQLDSRGQVTGDDFLIASEVYASVEPLNGRELELAQQQFAAASTRVRLYVDENWGLAPPDYLLREAGGPRLNIGHIAYDREIEREAVLTCGEEAGPLIPGTAPDPPSAISATAINETTVEVAFIPASSGEPAATYRLYHSMSSGGPYLNVASGPTSPITHDTATSGVENFYIVRGVSLDGTESLDSNEVSATTPTVVMGGLSDHVHTSTGGSVVGPGIEGGTSEHAHQSLGGNLSATDPVVAGGVSEHAHNSLGGAIVPQGEIGGGTSSHVHTSVGGELVPTIAGGLSSHVHQSFGGALQIGTPQSAQFAGDSHLSLPHQGSYTLDDYWVLLASIQESDTGIAAGGASEHAHTSAGGQIALNLQFQSAAFDGAHLQLPHDASYTLDNYWLIVATIRED